MTIIHWSDNLEVSYTGEGEDSRGDRYRRDGTEAKLVAALDAALAEWTPDLTTFDPDDIDDIDHVAQWVTGVGFWHRGHHGSSVGIDDATWNADGTITVQLSAWAGAFFDGEASDIDVSSSWTRVVTLVPES